MNFVCFRESGVLEVQIDLIDLDSRFGIDCFLAICGSLGWLGIMKAVFQFCSSEAVVSVCPNFFCITSLLVSRLDLLGC